MDAKKWNKLLVLGNKQGSIKLSDLSQELELKEEDALIFLRQIFPQGSGLEIYHENNECWIDINAEAVQYMLPPSPGEWIELQKALNSAPLNSFERPQFQSLKRKISDNGPVRAVMELLDQLQVWDQELSEEEQKFLSRLDAAVSSQQLLEIKTREGKVYQAFPCKVLHLEGHLSLIAEDLQDHCLMVLALNEIVKVEDIPGSGSPKVTLFELEEFIGCIRAMNDKETRLILKIYDASMVNLFPDHHFLGKPCMVTNPNGDLIWAAYVEPCDALFEWVSSLGEHVEILDPNKFKEQYFLYWEEKLRKTA